MRSFLCVFSLILILAPVAGNAQPLLWKSRGGDNTVYLLGSIHALTENDYPLPQAYEAAYQDADKTIFEINLTPEATLRLQSLMFRLGSFEGDKTLKSVMGEDEFNRLNQEAMEHGFSLEMMNGHEPWLSMLIMASTLVVQAGLNPENGVDMYFQDKAAKDGKEIGQLETPRQQLGFFDNLDMKYQILLLKETIEEFDNAKPLFDKMLAAWREGDTKTLEKLMNDELHASPQIAEVLLYNRNKNWAEKIDEYFDDDEDYLIIVGAGHLVGDQSVIELLEAKGHSFNRAK